MCDVLIYVGDCDDLAHKTAAEIPEGHEPYWEVRGTPRQTEPGQDVLFTGGERVRYRAAITAIEEGCIWFEPLEPVDEPLPARPTTRGFKYVNGGETA